MKPILMPVSLCALLVTTICADAATLLTVSKSVNADIPDNNTNGLVSTITINSGGQTVSSVEVAVDTSNGWNGDLYVYLEHDGVVSMLLNRPGRTTGNPFGAASGGMQIRFADSAAADIHTTISNTFGAIASGTYQPDARAEDPDLVTNNSARSLFLGGFESHNADGSWTLFAADLAGGDVARLNNWTLYVTVVPEPPGTLLLFVGATGALLIRNRKPCDSR